MLASWRGVSGVVAAASLAASFVLLAALPAAATIDKGSCTASATASQSGSIDLTSKATWTLVTADTVNGQWLGPTQTQTTIGAVVFGFPFPVYTSTGKDTKGSAGPFNIADYAKYGRVIAVSGSSDDCHGTLTIIIKDANAFTNYISLAAIALTVLGLLILLSLAFSRPNLFKRVLGALAGFLVGLGVGVLLIEIGTLDPQAAAGAALPVVVIVLGIFIPGTLYHVPTAPAAPVTPSA